MPRRQRETRRSLWRGRTNHPLKPLQPCSFSLPPLHRNLPSHTLPFLWIEPRPAMLLDIASTMLGESEGREGAHRASAARSGASAWISPRQGVWSSHAAEMFVGGSAKNGLGKYCGLRQVQSTNTLTRFWSAFAGIAPPPTHKTYQGAY